MNEVLKHKLIFIETPDAIETSAALENYRRVSEILFQSLHLSLIASILSLAGLRQWSRSVSALRRSRESFRRNRFRSQLRTSSNHVRNPLSSAFETLAIFMLSLLIDKLLPRTVHRISYPQSSIGILEGYLSNQGERFLDVRRYETCCSMCWTCTAR